MLAAPTAPDDRLPRICARARGFVYAVGLLGVTGERDALAASATSSPVASRRSPTCRCSSASACPHAEQAVEVSRVADGVVVGSAIVRRMLEGAGPTGWASSSAEFRAALDAG